MSRRLFSRPAERCGADAQHAASQSMAGGVVDAACARSRSIYMPAALPWPKLCILAGGELQQPEPLVQNLATSVLMTFNMEPVGAAMPMCTPNLPTCCTEILLWHELALATSWLLAGEELQRPAVIFQTLAHSVVVTLNMKSPNHG